MAWLAMALSLLIALVGAIGVVSPDRLLDVARLFESQAGLYAAATLRILLGGALIFAAPASRAPRPLQAIGFMILVVGIVTPFFGVDRVRTFFDWWAAQGPPFIRIWSATALAIGALLAFAVFPRAQAG